MPQRSHWPEGRMQGFSSTVKWDPSFDLAIRRWENEVIEGLMEKSWKGSESRENMMAMLISEAYEKRINTVILSM